MAKVIDNKLDSLDTSWEGYAGRRVEEFIKDRFRGLDTSKYGYLSVESGDAGLQTMRFLEIVIVMSNGLVIKLLMLITYFLHLSFIVIVLKLHLLLKLLL